MSVSSSFEPHSSEPPPLWWGRLAQRSCNRTSINSKATWQPQIPEQGIWAGAKTLKLRQMRMNCNVLAKARTHEALQFLT